MLAVGLACYQQSKSGGAAIEHDTETALRDNATKSLVAVSAARRLDIQHYFQSMQAHLVSLAADSDLVHHMVAMSTDFTELANGKSPEEIEQARRELEISSNLSNSMRMIETVGRNVTEGVSASREISQAISEVDRLAGSTAASAEETSVAGKSMTQLSTELMSIVGQFRF